eukprot:CAMPEP_0184986654 /NCGR_PEP_ID=MMETSP1098-20130426/17321_1 /TAXON_ID=89044 /ORGANISM="Spumella elongata, Strain CCAP 955/1" /LENGTH=80 /DNA_ID=CAMNT_0027510993 /DNA_START=41 /DNA_END=279 /DNA_ORIENTATION=-
MGRNPGELDVPTRRAFGNHRRETGVRGRHDVQTLADDVSSFVVVNWMHVVVTVVVTVRRRVLPGARQQTTKQHMLDDWKL